MAISFKEQIDNFSNDFYINTAYIPYIVNGPECADGLSGDELKKIDDFLDKWSYVDCSEEMLDSPDLRRMPYLRYASCGHKGHFYQ